MVRGCEVRNRKWRDEAESGDGDSDEDVGWPVVANHGLRVLNLIRVSVASREKGKR